MNNSVVIEWSADRLKRFKRAFKNCETDTFIFDGNEFYRPYAKYLIEYLDGVFK